jgi:hypothetical protein
MAKLPVAAAEYWVPACAGMTFQRCDERMKLIRSNRLKTEKKPGV